jgi:hypothetical protein
MICPACKYEKGWSWVNGEYVDVNLKGKDFVLITGTFSVLSSGHSEEINLKACPECGCVVFNRYE